MLLENSRIAHADMGHAIKSHASCVILAHFRLTHARISARTDIISRIFFWEAQKCFFTYEVNWAQVNV